MSSTNNDCISINNLVETIAQKFEDSLFVIIIFDPYLHLNFDRMKIQPLKIVYVNKYIQYIPIDNLFKDIRYISAPEYMVENVRKDMDTVLIIDIKESKANNYSDPLPFQSTYTYPMVINPLTGKY